MSVFGPDPACAVAAAILTGGLDDLVTADDQDWAVTQLIDAAGKLAPFEYRDNSDAQAASRAAARALATAYARAITSRDDDILGALHRLAAHPVLEVRRTLVTNLGAIWSAPCRTTSSGRCMHQDAADLLTTLIRDAVIPEPGRRSPPRSPRSQNSHSTPVPNSTQEYSGRPQPRRWTPKRAATAQNSATGRARQRTHCSTRFSLRSPAAALTGTAHTWWLPKPPAATLRAANSISSEMYQAGSLRRVLFPYGTPRYSTPSAATHRSPQ